MYFTSLVSYNSATVSQQQKAVDQFVGQYVQCCQTSLVEWVLEKSFEGIDAPLQYDDITNNEPTGSVSISGRHVSFWETLTEYQRDEKLEHYEYLRDKAQTIFDSLDVVLELVSLSNPHDSEKYSTLSSRLNQFETGTLDRLISVCCDLEALDFDDCPEVLEWWACDQWLVARLEEAGECTLDGGYWGRCTSGQSISLDEVIVQIYKDTLNS